MSDKPFKSSNDITISTNRLYENNSETGDNNSRGGGGGGGSGSIINYNENGKRTSTFSQGGVSECSSQVINNNNTTDNTNHLNNGRIISGNRRNLPKHQRPLTRYLPIMSLDLDLRQHIESAGHQVTLCPYVVLDSYSCKG